LCPAVRRRRVDYIVERGRWRASATVVLFTSEIRREIVGVVTPGFLRHLSGVF
jgi:hypothetical protein